MEKCSQYSQPENAHHEEIDFQPDKNCGGQKNSRQRDHTLKQEQTAEAVK